MVTKGDKRKNYRLFLYKLLERLKIRGTISFPTKLPQSLGFGRKLLNFVKAIHLTLQLNVYKKKQKAISFYLREGFLIISENIDDNTQELELSMTWTNL